MYYRIKKLCIKLVIKTGKKYVCISRSFLVINVCNQGKTLCSPCISTSFVSPLLSLLAKTVQPLHPPTFPNLTDASSYRQTYCTKDKAVPLQAWSGPQGSMKLSFTDFMTTAQVSCKFVSLMHRPPLPPGNTPGTHFC
jgi:hypothetical protein